MTFTWFIRETAAYALLGILLACVVGAGGALVVTIGGPLGATAGIGAAAAAAQALRRPVGLALGALVDGR